LAKELASRVAADGVAAEVESAVSEPGGGSLPGVQIPTFVVSLPGNADAIARRLRCGDPAVIGYVRNGSVLLDLRCVEEAEISELASAVAAACR
jgi:L-seryl-tRNA(Ser) seleniumtransferase